MPVPLTVPTLPQILKTPRAVDATRAFAELSSVLESRLATAPDDYGALATLGEMRLRTGRIGDALSLLRRATLQPPPSWAAYQRTSALLRKAESRAEHSFERAPADQMLPSLVPLRSLLGRVLRLSGRRRGNA